MLEGNEVKDLDSPGRQIPSAKAAALGAGEASAGQGWQGQSREQHDPGSTDTTGLCGKGWVGVPSLHCPAPPRTKPGHV